MNYQELELYIHIPFCLRKCLYCDFLSFAVQEKCHEAYTDKLVQEIQTQGAGFSGRRVVSIFVGGGTPSILSAAQIRKIFAALRESFELAEDAEITIEANPGTLTTDRLQAYRECGINRLSLGLQSADDDELKALGRIHTFEDFLKSFQDARYAGFDNINIDLMSALPGQDLASWKNTLKKVLMLRPEHISAYSLILEPGTPFYEHYVEHPEESDEKRELDFVAVASKKAADGTILPVMKSNLDGTKKRKEWLPLPDEDTDREMYHFTKEFLAQQGFERYEISNYAKPGFECRHNIGYWTGVDYLGLGLGASSMVSGYRFHNTQDYQEYMDLDLTVEGAAARDIEKLTQKDKMEEFMFLGLRMTKGVSGSRFMEKYGQNMWNVYADVIPRLKDQGLIEVNMPEIRLTELGLDVSNTVFSQFLLD